MSSRGGRGGRRPRAEQPRAMRAIKQLSNSISGHKVTPSMNPTAFVQRPWNSWTFERAVTTEAELATTSITAADIVTQLRGFNGIAAEADVLIKVQSSSVWCTASSLIYPDLEVAFYEISGESSTSLQQERSLQRDKGTLNVPARCGYQFPLADRKEILGSNQGALDILTARVTDIGSKLTMRVHVLWQSRPAGLRTFDLPGQY